MKIALVMGGMSSEREVALNTGKSFEEALKSLKYNYVTIDAGPDLPAKLIEAKPDVALLALHGKYAEDGTVQGLCEYMKIPYSGSGVMASALCMNKYFTKQILTFHNILTPQFEFFKNETSPVLKKLKFPVVIKPSRDGSTVGISVAKNADEFQRGIMDALKYDKEILVEEFIPGMEVTVPILDDRVLTPIEIVPQEGFYDYQRKYTAGKTEYLLPPRLPEDVIEKIKQISLKVHQATQCRVYSRVDFRVTPTNELYVLEINTLPGCTKTSLLPKSAAKDGIEFAQVVDILIKKATLDYAGVS